MRSNENDHLQPQQQQQNGGSSSPVRLRDPMNSYKCYDLIPTPSPIAQDGRMSANMMMDMLDCDHHHSHLHLDKEMHSNSNTLKSQTKVKLERAPSLDSLGNLSDQCSTSSDNGQLHIHETNSNSLRHSDTKCETQLDNYNSHHYKNTSLVQNKQIDFQTDDSLSDSDSIEDLKHITSTTQAQIHSKSLDFYDGEEVTQSEIPKDPVITAYLEKASLESPNDCVKSMEQFNINKRRSLNGEDHNEDDPIVIANTNLLGPISSLTLNSSIKNRRTSVASSGSVGRMETIIEEPIEPKVSVKEILARFETLRESAEVIIIHHHHCFAFACDSHYFAHLRSLISLHLLLFLLLLANCIPKYNQLK